MNKLLGCLLVVVAGHAWAVDANTANRAQLEQLRHVGPPLAEAILVARDQHGAFKDWADLMARVRGIRNAKAANALIAAGVIDGIDIAPPQTSIF